MPKGKILVVDDEVAICTSLTTLLKDAGYETTYALNGKDALSIIKTDVFDAMLIDISMPEMDGITLLKQIKDLDATMPVIILTAFPSNKTIDDSIKLHAYDYITKPFKPEKIYFVVERAVSYGNLVRKTKKS